MIRALFFREVVVCTPSESFTAFVVSGQHIVTAPQKSRISFLTFIVMGTLAVPALAFTAGAAMFSPENSQQLAGPILQAPPPVVLVALGLLMVAGAVTRRNRKSAAQRVAAQIQR